MIKISMKCRESDITNFVNSQDDMKKLFETINPILSNFFDNHCFLKSKYCMKIDTLDWKVNNEETLIVLRSNKSFFSTEELNE